MRYWRVSSCLLYVGSCMLGDGRLDDVSCVDGGQKELGNTDLAVTRDSPPGLSQGSTRSCILYDGYGRITLDFVCLWRRWRP
ncbi:hypothetical protein P154DRAFT_74030 [Amniculicola lignicola CBS 123094]|uniref:Uncharacterized protein n=1 Tax=Amniculicola lignicola CBS 123094 TaxID=1392246 RepID=A0A6A5WT08_9PLEO|nr:hypothetical protein P154DRAFT_74030 [Amniculicola lignicola CBS 123094]